MDRANYISDSCTTKIFDRTKSKEQLNNVTYDCKMGQNVSEGSTYRTYKVSRVTCERKNINENMSNNLWTERIYKMSETEIFERQSNRRQSATNNLSLIKLQKNPAFFQQ